MVRTQVDGKPQPPELPVMQYTRSIEMLRYSKTCSRQAIAMPKQGQVVELAAEMVHQLGFLRETLHNHPVIKNNGSSAGDGDAKPGALHRPGGGSRSQAGRHVHQQRRQRRTCAEHRWCTRRDWEPDHFDWRLRFPRHGRCRALRQVSTYLHRASWIIANVSGSSILLSWLAQCASKMSYDCPAASSVDDVFCACEKMSKPFVLQGRRRRGAQLQLEQPGADCGRRSRRVAVSAWRCHRSRPPGKR